jgi:hypothetical protein
MTMPTDMHQKLKDHRPGQVKEVLEFLQDAVSRPDLTDEHALAVIEIGKAALALYDATARALSTSTSDHFLFGTDLPRTERDQRGQVEHLLGVLGTINAPEGSE